MAFLKSVKMHLSAYSLILKIRKLFLQEKVQCHFNDKGIFIEPCKIEVPTEKLINENQIRGENEKHL